MALHETDPNGRPVILENEDGTLVTLPATAGSADDDLTWAVNCLANARVKLSVFPKRHILERLEVLLEDVRGIVKDIKKPLRKARKKT